MKSAIVFNFSYVLVVEKMNISIHENFLSRGYCILILPQIRSRERTWVIVILDLVHTITNSKETDLIILFLSIVIKITNGQRANQAFWPLTPMTFAPHQRIDGRSPSRINVDMDGAQNGQSVFDRKTGQTNTQS